ncbi:GNAT family N-acetyltransferase [Trinickia soli]|uniref:N-acetyltransferase n=1 Tax=Trinickia soli TaxID=380675 RepID=A0A2N7W3T9_9BURK|nr:GNAT family N-acetyltransferase [Trinickia soli]PMS24065.1 N-acetyltransferase [Trinickia soli]CAB3701857.1 Acetyltransferase [Trinickia soli]
MLPALDTARLLIRERTLADLESCLEMDRDPEVTRHIAGPWSDPVAHRQFVQHRITRQYPPGLGYWSIRERADPDRFIGWVLLIPDHGSGPDVEIGWRLVRSAWGRGIASEAARALVKHAFETVGLPRVIADIAAENRASLHVARKLGMQWLGYDTSDGKRYERYRLVRDDLR